jgi:xanthine dehydrogenase accessory factor
MLVFGDGRIVGRSAAAATRTTRSGKAREAIPAAGRSSCTTSWSDDFAQETGLICGGQMDVYIEPIEPSPELYIVGAGTSAFISPLAAEVGFRVHVVDDREKFANAERFPDRRGNRRRRHPGVDRRSTIPRHAYVVIVTRGHTNDLDALRALAPRETALPRADRQPREGARASTTR